MIQVGATSLGFGLMPLPEVFRTLRELGGECIELNSQPGLHDGLVLDPASARVVRRWASEYGIAIRSVGGYNDFAQDEPETLALEVERLRGTCRLAAEVGAGIVRAFVGEPKPGVTLAAVRPLVIEAFQEVASHAGDLGLVVAIENHGALLNDGPGLASLVEAIGSPWIGLAVDSGNFSWGGHDPAATGTDFEAVVPFAVSVHVKDGVWRGGEFEFVPAGQGELDLVGLLVALRRADFAGPVYSEYEGPGDFFTGTRESIAFLRSACTAAEQAPTVGGTGI